MNKYIWTTFFSITTSLILLTPSLANAALKITKGSSGELVLSGMKIGDTLPEEYTARLEKNGVAAFPLLWNECLGDYNVAPHTMRSTPSIGIMQRALKEIQSSPFTFSRKKFKDAPPFKASKYIELRERKDDAYSIIVDSETNLIVGLRSQKFLNKKSGNIEKYRDLIFSTFGQPEKQNIRITRGYDKSIIAVGIKYQPKGVPIENYYFKDHQPLPSLNMLAFPFNLGTEPDPLFFAHVDDRTYWLIMLRELSDGQDVMKHNYALCQQTLKDALGDTGGL